MQLPTSTGMGNFPFKCYLSLKPILDFWLKEEASCTFTFELKSKIVDYLAQYPELSSQALNPALLAQHQDFVQVIMTGFYSRAAQNSECKAILLPFNTEKIFATPAYHNLKLTTRPQTGDLVAFMERLAYVKILREVFDIDLYFEHKRHVFEGRLPGDDFDGFWQLNLNLEFCHIEYKGDARQLSQNDRARIVANLDDINVWREIIPPDQFIFYGVQRMTFINVTELEIMSRIKQGLIDRRAIVDSEKFNVVEGFVRRLFKDKSLKMSLSVFLPKKNSEWEIVRFRSGISGGINAVYEATFRFDQAAFTDSIYCRTLKEGHIQVFADLQTTSSIHGVDLALVKEGIRNIAVVPLFFGDKKVGFLDISSDIPGRINDMNSWLLAELTPLFSMSVNGLVESMMADLDSVIRKNCTVIHPCVEWRFQEAAIASYRRQDGELALMSDIVFDHVFPLFGLSDIRGSSTLRNQAIKDDLFLQLSLARSILEKAVDKTEFYFLESMIFRIKRAQAAIRQDIDAANEVTIVNFLKNDVEAIFNTIKDLTPEIGAGVTEYFATIDKDLKIIYQRRKAFDDSIKILNNHLCEYLDSRQVAAQNIFPHYFEKQATDGVDHSIYIGQSLVSGKVYSPIYLRNIRLWQLMVMCGSEAIAHLLKGDLPIPLELAHLLIVQNAPLTIGFDYDEKKFGVEGAYNIRYEIVKKRIDKAKVKGTGERLTQPGQVAIVYSQDSEKAEYLEYLEFLTDEAWLREGHEEVALEDLQGVHGLKALRVHINTAAVVKRAEVQSFLRNTIPVLVPLKIAA